jgi:glycosyltransferase involved in cell wall biosynthesis
VNILWLSWKDVRHPEAGGAERLGHLWRTRLVGDGHAVTHITAGYEGAPPVELLDGVVTRRYGRSRLLHYPLATAAATPRARVWADLVIEEVNTMPYFAGHLAPRGRHILLYFQLAREIWFYQMPFPVSAAGYVAEALYTRLQALWRSPVITISADSRRDLARLGVGEDAVQVVRPAIENLPLERYVPEDKQDSFTVLFHSSLRAMKRPMHAVRAFEWFIASGGRGQLWLSGGGDDSALRRRVASTGLTSRVTFWGRVSDARKLALMRQASVLVSTSVKEGWGLVVTEANSMATPAIVYDVDGLRAAAGPHNRISAPSPSSLADRLHEAARTFDHRHQYDDWCRAVLDDSRQYSAEASYAEFRAALMRSVVHGQRGGTAV